METEDQNNKPAAIWSIVIILTVIFFGPFALPFLILFRKEWWQHKSVKVATIAWSAVYVLIGVNGMMEEKPPQPVVQAESGHEAEVEEEIDYTPSEVEEVIIDEENASDEAEELQEGEPDTTPTLQVVDTPPAPQQEPEVIPESVNSQPTRPTQPVQPVRPSTSTSSPADTNANSSTPLPLKAICKDGAISYQDDPYGKDYRGMCSHHGGIAKKLGRVE